MIKQYFGFGILILVIIWLLVFGHWLFVKQGGKK